MTVNGLISAEYVVAFLVLLVMGSSLVWQARHYLREWPASVLLAIGGWVLSLTIVVGHLVILRLFDPVPPFHGNGDFTLLTRSIFTFLTTALAYRVVRKQLATKHDLARLKGRT